MEPLEEMLMYQNALRQRRTPSVMNQAPAPAWQPEYEKEPPLEAVSPEDFIPNPKSLAAGAIGAVKGQKELLALLAKGKLPGNQGIRYEVAGRPLFDPGVVHYDVAGGRQATDIMKFPMMDGAGEFLSRKQVIQNNKDAQFRVGDFKNIPEGQATYVPDDMWLDAINREGLIKPGEHQFYPNLAEGNWKNIRGLPDPKVKDILNDPELRKAYNLSLAAPVESKFHMLARILRDAK